MNRETVTDWVHQLPSITLEELNDNAALQTRVDRKYILTAAQAGQLLPVLAAGAQVLQIDQLRSFRYSSVYFDTPELASFHLAAPAAAPAAAGGAEAGPQGRFKIPKLPGHRSLFPGSQDRRRTGSRRSGASNTTRLNAAIWTPKPATTSGRRWSTNWATAESTWNCSHRSSSPPTGAPRSTGPNPAAASRSTSSCAGPIRSGAACCAATRWCWRPSRR